MNFNVGRVRVFQEQMDKFEVNFRKRYCNPHPLVKRLVNIKNEIGKKVDPNWEKNKKRYNNKKGHKENRSTKEIIKKMPMKYIKNIRIKEDEIFKEVKKEDNPMTKDFKTIEEINRLIKNNSKKYKESKEETNLKTIINKYIDETEEIKGSEGIELPFEIDPKIFESSGESFIYSDENSLSNLRNEMDNPKDFNELYSIFGAHE